MALVRSNIVNSGLVWRNILRMRYGQCFGRKTHLSRYTDLNLLELRTVHSSYLSKNYFSSFMHRVPSLQCSDTIPSLTATQKRFYAKKKDKGGKGKKGGKRSSLTNEELSGVINYEKMITQMDAVIDSMKQEFVKQLSLRSNLSSFDSLIIETEDGKFPLQQVAQIAQKGPSTIAINCGAMIQYLPAIKLALEKSGMNINPQVDKNTIFVPIPKVTREHRETLVKAAKTLSDKNKDKLKEIHNKYQRDAKKKTDVSEDLIRNVVETIHDKLHDYQATCEDLMKRKQEELLPK